MKKIISSVLLVLILVLSFISYNTFFSEKAQAAMSDWQKGASIFPYSSTDYSSASFQQSLRNLRATGANYVSLVIPIYQANDTSSDIFAGGDTPTDASLIQAINFAHSIGLKVMIKPHLGAQTNGWRATINASNRDAWFTNYGNFLNHLGNIGRQTGAEGMCIGTELISMATYTSNSDNTARWNTLISNLRTHFSGYLTYSANWGSEGFAEEVSHIGFWPALDFIGISAYYPLAQGQNNPSVDALISSWNNWNVSKIKPLYDQFHKQIIFTEVGYRSTENAHNDPFDGGRGGAIDLQEQKNDYQALFQYWNNYSYVAGVQVWNWESDPNYGGAGNGHYSPHNKPAEDILKQWFGGEGTPTPNPIPTPNPAPTGIFQSTVSTIGNSLGTPVNLTVNVTNTGQASDLIMDVEVYNSSNTQVFQKFFEHQTISSSQPGAYQTSWTPSAEGSYTVKVGVFNNNWSTNYYWGNDVAKVTVGTSQPTPTPVPTPTPNPTPTPPPTPNPSPSTFTTNIWWPSNGASVIGSQPFKAMVEGKDVSEYTMYWQVDGDQLNEMQNSSQDYPHKEVVVNVTGWNWKGAGPYTLNFVSKDTSGNIISQKSTEIYVK